MASRNTEPPASEPPASEPPASATRWRLVAVCLLWLTVLWMAAAVLYLSWVPNSRMELIPWVPSWLAAWADSGGRLQTARTGVPLVGVGLLVALSWRITDWRHWALGGLGSGIFLVLLAEGGQFLLPARNQDWADVWWGAGGAVAGVILAAAVRCLGIAMAWWFGLLRRGNLPAKD